MEANAPDLAWGIGITNRLSPSVAGHAVILRAIDAARSLSRNAAYFNPSGEIAPEGELTKRANSDYEQPDERQNKDRRKDEFQRRGQTVIGTTIAPRECHPIPQPLAQRDRRAIGVGAQVQRNLSHLAATRTDQLEPLSRMPPVELNLALPTEHMAQINRGIAHIPRHSDRLVRCLQCDHRLPSSLAGHDRIVTRIDVTALFPRNRLLHHHQERLTWFDSFSSSSSSPLQRKRPNPRAHAPLPGPPTTATAPTPTPSSTTNSPTPTSSASAPTTTSPAPPCTPCRVYPFCTPLRANMSETLLVA